MDAPENEDADDDAGDAPHRHKDDGTKLAWWRTETSRIAAAGALSSLPLRPHHSNQCSIRS